MIWHSRSTWTLWNKLRVASPLREFILLAAITRPIIQGLWNETRKDKKTNPDTVTVYLRGRAIWKTLESSRKGSAVFWGHTWERSELWGSNSPGVAPEKDQSSEEVARQGSHTNTAYLITLVTQNTSQLPSVSLKVPVVFLKKFKLEGNKACIYDSQVWQTSPAPAAPSWATMLS